MEVDTHYLEEELASQLATSTLSLSTPTKAPVGSSSGGGSSKKKNKKGSKKTGTASPMRSPMVVDISDCPEFLESKPPVFKIREDDAFIC